MKRFFVFIAGLLAMLPQLTSYAQQNNSDNKSLLWRISGKGLTRPSYLFGTMHQICPDDYVWTEKMKNSLAYSDKVCFEMDMDDPNVLAEVTMGLIDQSGKKLQDYFTPEQYKLVKDYIKDSLGMDIAAFQQMKPVVLQTLVGLKEGKCKEPISYEDSIMKTMQRAHKEVLGLETPKEQFEVLESLPVDSVVQQLMDAIQHPDNDDAEYQKMMAAYKQQDIPALYELITQSKGLGDDMGAFLDVRNKKWIPRMAEKMKKSSVFFAVGAGHLWGSNGVISLLRKDGYKVEAEK